MVLDADALTILPQRPDLFAKLHGGCILTPHAGEFARLFPDIAEKLAAADTKGPAYSKVDATQEAAARAGCVVLFKGPATVIADPSGRCSVNAAVYLLLLRSRPPRRLSQAAVTAEIDRLKVRVCVGGKRRRDILFLVLASSRPPFFHFPSAWRARRPPANKSEMGRVGKGRFRSV